MSGSGNLFLAPMLLTGATHLRGSDRVASTFRLAVLPFFLVPHVFFKLPQAGRALVSSFTSQPSLRAARRGYSLSLASGVCWLQWRSVPIIYNAAISQCRAGRVRAAAYLFSVAGTGPLTAIFFTRCCEWWSIIARAGGFFLECNEAVFGVNDPSGLPDDQFTVVGRIEFASVQLICIKVAFGILSTSSVFVWC